MNPLSGLNPDRWLLWDIDGTLVRFVGASMDKHAAAVESVLGRPVARDLRTAGMTDLQIVLAIFEAEGVDPSANAVDSAITVLDQLSEREMSAKNVCALKGAPEALAAAASAGWTNGLLTGNTPHRARIKLIAADLWPALQSGGGFFGDRHSDRFALAVECGAVRECGRQVRLVVVGDTPLDIGAARAAGLPVIAVATGRFDLDQLAKFEPDLVVGDLVSGLPDLLAYLNALD